MVSNYRRKDLLLLGPILIVSLGLNVAYNDWGLPGLWHPDEVTRRSARLILERTANPQFFAYPSLHIYTVTVLSIVPYLTVDHVIRFLSDVSRPELTLIGLTREVTVYARLLSAVLGTATVFLTYLVGRKMFDSRAGLYSAAFMAVAAGMVHFSHFATVDIPLVFWITLAFYACLIAAEQSSRRAYLIAAVVTGLAISVKYTAVLALPTLLLALAFGEQRRVRMTGKPRRIIAGPLLLGGGVLLGFVLGTPYALITPLDFAWAFVKLNFYQPAYGGMHTRGFGTHIVNLFEVMGPIMFALSALGLIYMLYLGLRKTHPSYILLIVTLLAFYLKLGSMWYHPERYALPFVPFLLLGAGKLVTDLPKMLESWPRARGASCVLIAFCFGFSAYYSGIGASEFGRSDRDRAQIFVIDNIAKDEHIEVSRIYGMERPQGYDNFHPLPHYHAKPTFLRMRQSELYQRLRGIYRKLRAEPEDYQAVEEIVMPPEPPKVSLEALLARSPQYLVLSESQYRRFLGDDGAKYFPLQHELYRAVLDGRTPYDLVADFRKRDHWLRPQLEFVNVGVTIHGLVQPDSHP